MKQKIDSLFSGENQIPKKYQLSEAIHQKEFLVDGDIKIWSGKTEDVYSPIYSKKEGNFENYIGSYPLMDEMTSLEALKAAKKAFHYGNGDWPSMTIEKRIQRIKHFVEIMKEQRGAVVKLLMWEIGKSLPDSEKEFDRTIDYIMDTVEALKNLDRKSSRFSITQGIIAQIRRAPLGVVLCMGPYNYPLNETFTTLIPALIMGNTIIFKPPKLGVLLHWPLLKAFQQAFPKGVVNTVYGDGKEVISPLMESGEVDVLAFIGTSRVADILKKQHPKLHRMKAVLGLEAKNPGIILPDADLEMAVQECVTGALSYNGQRCTALKILFVHDSIKDEFINRLTIAVEKLNVGMPWDGDVNLTPLPEEGKAEYLSVLVKDAREKGAVVVNPSAGLTNRSFYFPAIVSEVNSNMRLYHEEQFGPVIPIVTFSKIKEPLDYVIESNYGQQVSIFGKDPDQVARLIDTLVNQVCRVNINSQCQRGPDILPFTGRKDSAEGTLSVSDALRVFSIRTLVAVKENDLNKKIVRKIVREQKSNFLSTDFIL